MQYLNRDKQTQSQQKRQNSASETIRYKRQRTLSDNVPGYLPRRDTSPCRKQGEVLQMLRLRLNDDPHDNGQFQRLRRVEVSPPATAAISNTPAGDGLQWANTPAVAGRSLAQRIGDWWNEFSEYRAGGRTLAQDEDIIFEGHGSDIGMELYTPDKLAEKASNIILRCGYTAVAPWNGRLVLLGCDTGQFARQTAARLQEKVKFPVTVVGTQRNIRVNETLSGAMYAEDDWQPGDRDSPTNLNEIIVFHDFVTTFFEEMRVCMGLTSRMYNVLATQARGMAVNSQTGLMFRWKMKQFKSEFENVRNFLNSLAVPAQPSDIIFLPGGVPAQTDHYRGAVNGDRISIGIQEDAGTLMQNLLSDLSRFIQQIPVNGTLDYTGMVFFFVNNTGPFGYISDVIVNTQNSVNDMFTAFRIARSRRIDFQNPQHIVTARSDMP